MYNENKLRGKVSENRMTIATLAEEMGINYVTLYRKMVGKSEFTRAEMQTMKDLLHMSAQEFQEIFFSERLA